MTWRPERGGRDSGIRLFSDPRFLSVVLVGFSGVLGGNVVPPALPSIATQFAVSDAEVALVMTVFSLPPLLMVPVVGVLADLYGRRTIILASLAVYGVAGLGIVIAPDFRTVLALRLLQGVGYAGTQPLGVTLIGDLYAGERGTTAQGVYSSTLGIGNIVAPVLAGAALALGWFFPFIMFAAAFPAIALVGVYLPETADDQKAEATRVVPAIREYLVEIGSVVHDRAILIVYLGAISEYFAKYAILTFLPLFVVRRFGASGVVVGLLLSIYGIVRIVVSPFSGTAVERLSRRSVIIGALSLTAAAIAALPYSQNTLFVAVLMVAYSAGDSALSPVVNDTTVNLAPDPHRAGIVSGMNTCKNIGKTLAPAMLGVVLAATGFDVLFWTTAGIVLAYAGVVLVTTELDAVAVS